ncbi:MAG: hypothetical protein RMK57_11255 [Bryobacterales bacterium]|nr:hypothetical protein [Bryobacteraceae bacterium]MDW8355096.1 hypothetical protein [Bryobacterales bacterium]
MKRLASALLWGAAAAFAQSGLTPPLVGVIPNVSGRPALVYGVANSFVLGSSWDWERVEHTGRYLLAHREAEAAGGQLAVLTLEGEVLCRQGVPSGTVRFGFSASGEDALAWFAAPGQLVRVRGCTMEPLPLEPPVTDAVISLGYLADGRIGLVVRRSEGLALLEFSPEGRLEIESPLVNLSEPVVLLRDGTLAFAESHTVVLRSAEGFELRIVTEAPVKALHDLGPGWLLVALEGPWGRRAVRLRAGQLEQYYLPGTTP